MCGITGYYGNVAKCESEVILQKMLSRIEHRGPDESGIYLSNLVGLGSVRLSIIDLASGTMPISNHDGSKWIVFNGEIYNYLELRNELKSKGYDFKTSSDTEVVIQLYEEYGIDFLKKLNGQFAIAIWDNEKEELLLARDRVGIRPLYYTDFNSTLLFGSEIKSFLEFPNFNLELSPKAISEHFTFWTTLSPNTPFKGVYEVPPASYIIINSKGRESNSYWDMPLPKSKKELNLNEEEVIKEFEELLYNATKLRLRADVKVAAYLSGGLDSSVTTSFIKKIEPSVLRTFSIGFLDKEFDETSFQNLASEYFDTNHSSIVCKEEDIGNNFKTVVWHSEAPLLRTSPIPMYLLAKNVRENNIKVVITGEGADEILGGYNIFKENKIRHFWSKFPDSKLRPLLLKKLYPYLPQMSKSNSNVLKMFFGYKLTETDSPIYSHLLRWNNTSRIKNYLSFEYKEQVKGYNPILEIENRFSNVLSDLDPLLKAQYIEMKIFMSGYLLSSQGDRMAMGNSIEGRYPFLDHNVVEFCLSLPPEMKLKGLNEKFLLKKMAEGKIPQKILNRSKQAYRAPIKNSLLNSNAPDYLKDMLSNEKIRAFNIFNENHVSNLIKKMTANRQVSEIDNMALAGILSTQILYDLFILKNIPKLDSNNLIRINKKVLDF